VPGVRQDGGLSLVRPADRLAQGGCRGRQVHWLHSSSEAYYCTSGSSTCKQKVMCAVAECTRIRRRWNVQDIRFVLRACSRLHSREVASG
jgi:hypothetical protein